MTEREQREQSIMALENQRSVLGDEVVDAALASMQEKLSALIEAEKGTQQRKLATVLFVDILGRTSITQNLDPEDAMTVLEAAQQRLSGPVNAHGGRVTRFMGVSFLALFGAPSARENDPEMAVRAGLQILDEAQSYAREVEALWHIPDFNIRVGISTGMVIIGGDTEAENTITGTTVNLASRLRNIAKPGTLLISHHTYQQIHDMVDVQGPRAAARKTVEKVGVKQKNHVRGGQTHSDGNKKSQRTGGFKGQCVSQYRSQKRPGAGCRQNT